MGLGFSSRLFRDPGSRSRGSFVPSDDGSVAVEFAMLLTVLILFISGIITFGWMYYLENNMETAAREAARRMAVAEAPFVGADMTCAAALAGSPSNAEYIACGMLPTPGGTITVNAATLCPGDRAVRVQVSANGADVAIFDVFGFFNGTTLNATVDMRKEAECS